MTNIDLALWRWSGILLLAGGIIFWIGAFTPPYKQWMTRDIKEYLEIIHANPINWYVINGCFAAGMILTLLGVQLFSQALLGSGSSKIFTNIGVTSFVFGITLWVLNIAFRLTVTVWAANNLAETGQVYESFKTWMDWTNLIFAFYMVLAYFGTGCLGIALKDLQVLPDWLSWFLIIFGFAGSVGYIIRIPLFDPPLMVHLPFLLLGFMILQKLKP